MNTIDGVTQKVSESSLPSRSKQKMLEKISKEIQNEIMNFQDKRILKVIVGGSYAKGTWLEDDPDIDFFVMIDTTVERKEFEELGKSVGFYALKKYRPYLRYSEHPYVEGKVDAIRINIVPCYRVQMNNWKSAADRSPFHTIFMQGKLNEFLKSEVRVLKKFLKSIGIYGSQISVSGFSGYVTEVLVLKYGSFRNVLQIFAELSPNYVVSLDSPDEKAIEKFASPIIIIDPIDSNRNLGAAVSAECLAKFVLASRLFLKAPSTEFFIKSHRSNTKIMSDIKSNLLIIDFKIHKRSPDILWGQLKKKLNSVSKQLENAGFEIIKKFCFTDEHERAVFIFMIEFTNLPKINLNVGPKVFLKKETDSFIDKRVKKSIMTWTDDMRIVIIGERKNTSIKEHTSQIIQKDIESGSPTGISLDLKNGYSIYLGNERKKLGIFISNAIDHMVRDGEFIRQ
ncbi:MAG TPA: CCA tRNA nucleotidyltransferase [Nitrososphaeraceae archaeon]|jgi:tRNA nucleotidyltransferase (CCA-adding enzyme)|nr:CCA tRNA nucleotidyltransferase [Nitrososphaeraceae archaeon]